MSSNTRASSETKVKRRALLAKLKNQRKMKKQRKTPVIVESDEEGENSPQQILPSNSFIETESIEEDPTAEEVEVNEAVENGEEEEEEEFEATVAEGGELQEMMLEEAEEEDEGQAPEVEEDLPCFLCKNDMKLIVKDNRKMLFCSSGATVCSPPFTTAETYLALREMCKAVNPKYVHAKKGAPPRCLEHSLPMVLGFCKSTNEKFTDRPVFKCAVRTGKNPCTCKDDISFVKCTDALFGDLPNLAKARTEYKAYLAQIAAEKAAGIRAKNLIARSLKVQEAQERLASKKRKSAKVHENMPVAKRPLVCKTPENKASVPVPKGVPKKLVFKTEVVVEQRTLNSEHYNS